MTPGRNRLMTRLDDLGATMLEPLPPTPLADGAARLSVSLFALTTNNITYAAFGDSIGYWRVFPTGREGFGMMPVWGYADIIESRAPGVEVGERFWGYLPMASEIDVTPGRVTRYGFVDEAPHRRAVPGVYSRYTRCAADPHYRPELEAQQSIFRPLFITSYTAADMLRENGMFGAAQVVVSSASSKTAYGIAWCLRETGVRLIGLTSPGRRSFVEGLGCYDEVFAYDDLGRIAADVPTLFVDLAGAADLRARIHAHFGDTLIYDCLVGSTQNDVFDPDPALPGPTPTFFFAAERLDRHRDQHTLHAFLDRFERDQLTFIEHVASADPPWTRIVAGNGLDTARAIVRDLADGRSDPLEGHVVRL